YADDVKLARIIDNMDDCIDLQNDINSFVNRCTSNFMLVNKDKCNIISFTRKNNNIVYEYSMLNSPVKRCYEFRDLGVITDPALTFVPHIESICKKAVQMFGFIIRNTKEFTNLDCLK